MRIEILPASGACVLALAAALAGCATAKAPATAAAVVMPPAAPEAPPPATNIVTEPVAVAAARPTVAPADQVLAYGERIRGLPPAELAQEVQRLGEAPATPVRSLQLALALTQQRNAAQAPRVQSLLQRVLQDPEAQALHPLARLLTEQRRLEEQSDRQAQQLRDQQRRIEQLNERLEAVRAIERSLPAQPATRENGAAPARRPASAARPAP